ncbi:MAG TPA: lytic transglycosylase domain-containing protein [Thermoanaerobaculia bacterium]|nr:lytic transglycosylase domain-containing protein [Thermoanaerobaculia bacterium]
MPEPKTCRAFQERFLDGYDRSQLRLEVQKVKPKRLQGLRKKYATWALGGALALGGMGVPLKMAMTPKAETGAIANPPQPQPQPLETQAQQQTQIDKDLATAQQIANQVTGGVQKAVTSVAETAAQAPAQIAQTVAQAPQQVADIAEQAKANFFKTQVPFGSIIYSAALKNDLPPELVAAVAHTESKFQPTARSGAGAVGLMQLVPRTGRWLGVQNLTDPAQNIMAGAKYLKYLTDRFDGDQTRAIAAYNAGEGAVRRFGGIPPYRETQSYVQRVRDFQRDLGSQMQNQLADVQGGGPGL